jgi:hypothetical protein
MKSRIITAVIALGALASVALVGAAPLMPW